MTNLAVCIQGQNKVVHLAFLQKDELSIINPETLCNRSISNMKVVDLSPNCEDCIKKRIENR